MKLPVIDHKPQVDSSPNVEVSVMGMNMNKVNIASYYLRDKIYSNKPLAVVREYICNALDEHKKYNIEQPIFADILCEGRSYYFVVRDYAKGLDDHSVRYIFGSMFESTKNGENESTGGFGIGSKSAHSYTDSFEVHSYYNGSLTYYSCDLESEKDSHCPIGKIRNLGSIPTTETGLMIKVPIKPQDYYKFLNILSSYLNKLNPSIKVETSSSVLSSEYVQNLVFEFDGGSIYSVSYGNAYISPEHHFIRMGNCTYPLLDIDREYSDLFNKLANPICFEVPIGTFSVSLSREFLEKTTKNVEAFTKCLKQLENSFNKSCSEVEITHSTIKNVVECNNWKLKIKDILDIQFRCIFNPVHADPAKDPEMSIIFMIPNNRSVSEWSYKIDGLVSKNTLENTNYYVAKLDYDNFNLFQSILSENDKVPEGVKVYSCKKLRDYLSDFGFVYTTTNNKNISSPSYKIKYKSNTGSRTPEDYRASLGDIPKLEDLESAEEVWRYCITKDYLKGYKDIPTTGSVKMFKSLVNLGVYDLESPEVEDRLKEIHNNVAIRSRIENAVRKFNNNIYVPSIVIRSDVSGRYTKKRANRLEKNINKIESVIDSIKKEYTIRGNVLNCMGNYYFSNKLTRKSLREILKLKQPKN